SFKYCPKKQLDSEISLNHNIYEISMENENSIRAALKTGEISLQKLLKLGGKRNVTLKVFFEHAVSIDTGRKASISNPMEITLKSQKKDEIYGHTLLKEFSHQLGKLKQRRIIQF